MSSTGFVPPVYPFDLLDELTEVANAHDGGIVDLSVGTPGDPPPEAVVKALSSSGAERGYPAGVGSARLLDSARGWIDRRFGVSVERSQIAACIGTKEIVAGIPHWLHLRSPERDTVLYPAVSYPTYAMGADLALCRSVAVPVKSDGTLDLESIDQGDLSRALCLWVNSPSNPTGELDDLMVAAAFGREHNVPVFSDECYSEYTWDETPKTILSAGLDGVVALHSISKRSNCAGLRMGFYAGDPELVHYLRELRRHAGFMVPGPIQAAAAVALDDDEHVDVQRGLYRERLEYFIEILGSIGVQAVLPGGGFYLWVKAPAEIDADIDVRPGEDNEASRREWAFTRFLARVAGTLVSPGEFYGESGVGHVRIAMVQPMDKLGLVAQRLKTYRG